MTSPTCAIPIVLALLVASAASARADESGTLVVLARTSTVAIVAVDSRVTDSSGNQDTETDARRKLIEVGRSGACAIERWIGYKASGVVLADQLRDVVHSEPEKNVSEILDTLLTRAATSWDGMRYPLFALPDHRKVGSTITSFLCADFIDGRPQLFRGITEVGTTGEATRRRLPDECGGLLYIGGYMQLEVFADISDRPAGVERRFVNQNGPDIQLARIAEALSLDEKASTAFGVWKRTVGATVSSGQLSCQPGIAIDWSTEAIHQMTRGLFVAVEKYAPEVASPNNVRIIWARGRIATTVEDNWNLMPPNHSKPKQRPSHSSHTNK